MKKIYLIVFTFFFCLVVNAEAVVMSFPDFSDVSSLTLNGDAQTMPTQDGIILRLTPAEGNRSGSAFSTQAVNASTFSTYFEFRITEPGGRIYDCNDTAGADGIVFVIQSIASDIGSLGQGIGYAGIDTSIGVEFDTWCNAANNDPNSNHLGIDINGSVVHDPAEGHTKDITPDFDDGNVWHAWIDYDGGTLEARINQSGERPEMPDISMEVDIPSLLGQNDAFIGFTSATGHDWGNHDILYWEYRDTYDPIKCEKEYQEGYEAGREACIADPASCGIEVGGDYQAGYDDGYSAGLMDCSGGDDCPEVIISENLDIHIPYATYNTLLGEMHLWLDIRYMEDFTWSLTMEDLHLITDNP